jgi:hypothetical protein
MHAFRMRERRRASTVWRLGRLPTLPPIGCHPHTSLRRAFDRLLYKGSLVMQNVPTEAGEVAKRLAQVIFQVLEFVWTWSFGQVLAMFRLPLNSLPLWKQLLFLLVLSALGYIFHRVSKDFLKAMQTVVTAMVGFGTALIGMMPQIVWAGLIAFGGAWIMTNMNPTWIPAALR